MRDQYIKPVPPYDEMVLRTAQGRKCTLGRYSCHGCKKPFYPDNGKWHGTQYVEATIEHSFMRGDDEVHFFHPACTPKKQETAQAGG
jgi:hypothetical protein